MDENTSEPVDSSRPSEEIATSGLSALPAADPATTTDVADVASLENDEERSMAELIESGAFDLALQFCRLHPEAIQGIDPTTGATVLHLLCRKPPVPMELLREVLNLYPEAARVQERLYLATPLHILVWTSQRTCGKVELLLKYMKPEDLELRNRFGGTPLHSACGSQASLQVIQQIVRKNPSIVSAKTFEYSHTALTALWQSHLQSIQGHMQIARILRGNEVNEGHFDRFWGKVKFLATAAFQQSSGVIREKKETNSHRTTVDADTHTSMMGISYGSDHLLHGLLELRAPLNALIVAIKLYPEGVSVADDYGNFPLHSVISQRPFRAKDVEIIRELLEVKPAIASKKNYAGDTPIFIAIRERMAWDEGLGDLVKACPNILGSIDLHTGLYPFLLAASLSGKVAVNTTYQLLSQQPDLLKEASLC